MSKENSILVIEDHPLVAESTRGLLSNMDSSLKATICTTAQTALSEFQKRNDWFRIFLDIDIPGAHGLSLARQLAQFGVANKCVVITASNNPRWRAEVISMGMLGYIVKATRMEDFVFALEEVLKGRSAFPKMALDEQTAVRLTRRQQDILCLLHRGYTSKKIATQFGTADRTVDNQVSALLKALGVKNRGQAIARGIELGYIGFSDISRHSQLVGND